MEPEHSRENLSQSEKDYQHGAMRRANRFVAAQPVMTAQLCNLRGVYTSTIIYREERVWGNWFNQELFGKPTELPWALEIDYQHRPNDFTADSTFHPTFLYEAVWNLLLAFLLVRCDRAGFLKPGRLIGIWMLGYGLGRHWIEALRIDNASLIFGVSVNIWMSLIAILSGLLVVFFGRKRSIDSMKPSEGF